MLIVDITVFHNFNYYFKILFTAHTFSNDIPNRLNSIQLSAGTILDCIENRIFALIQTNSLTSLQLYYSVHNWSLPSIPPYYLLYTLPFFQPLVTSYFK